MSKMGEGKWETLASSYEQKWNMVHDILIAFSGARW